MTGQGENSGLDLDLDRGPRGRERSRLCAATRTVHPVSELIRFVMGPNGEAVADVKSKLPGRGIWITATRQALGAAIKRNAFARGFKREVRLSADLVERTDHLLERAVLDALAIAGKAGLVAAGFGKAAAALENGKVVALLHAAGASPEGIRKLDAARRRQPSERPLAVIGFLTSEQLDLALHRPNVVHAALLAGPASETFLARCRRLERFRTGDQHNQADGRRRISAGGNERV
ncbi:MAG TPA: RNA-binding protein [Xanthobacteraceae bacterium]|nr:RNA-binding protein [Xanthobacteraceae bacterium]